MSDPEFAVSVEISDHPVLAWVLGAVVFLLGLLVLFFDSIPGYEKLVDNPRVAAAIINAIGTIAGVLISLLVGNLRDRKAAKIEQQRVAAALLNEVFAHGGMIIGCLKELKPQVANKKPLFRHEVMRMIPPRSIVFEALASRIAALPYFAASSTVAFYGSVDAAQRASSDLPETLPPVGLVTSDQREVLSRLKAVEQLWCSAADNAEKAMKALGALVPAAGGSPGKALLNEMIENLNDMKGKLAPADST